MKSLLILSLLMALTSAFAFAPCSFTSTPRLHTTTSRLFMAKRKKLSFAEKRKRRAKRLPPRPITGKPVTFEKAAEQEAVRVPDDDEEVPPTQRAEQVVQAQRKSVDTLTLVRERVEALDYQDIQTQLTSTGYYVVDDFLSDSDIVSELQEEGVGLLNANKMEVDLGNLGSGEYVCKIEGGEEQYKSCPRSVEFVVSTAKHMAPAFRQEHLDALACMATMRTYNHKAQEASRELLKGGIPERPMDIIATEDGDVRRISLLYYPIANEWQEDAGVSFENGETIRAKRDRLILLKSDTCRHRREPWNGNLDHASCIELHLIQSSS